jgi:predicted secreted Zn-dependent protease
VVRFIVLTKAVFEDEATAERATMAVEKEIHQGGDGPVERVEEIGEKGPIVGHGEKV